MRTFGMIYAYDELGEFIVVSTVEDGILAALMYKAIINTDWNAVDEEITAILGYEAPNFEVAQDELGYDVYNEIVYNNTEHYYPDWEEYAQWKLSILRERYPEYWNWGYTIERHCW